MASGIDFDRYFFLVPIIALCSSFAVLGLFYYLYLCWRERNLNQANGRESTLHIGRHEAHAANRQAVAQLIVGVFPRIRDEIPPAPRRNPPGANTTSGFP
ncbi:MAG: hypothetical protein A3F12_03565 [Gammaproteobacteria bacterium RIFCSPHIGHO2_12_FULL_38_14]|nr:MAG: hypothetical protein A3F12_03565 [Gammaproteobacteria bacterium RIFCSPHIGHO2_12_FULL_38_14]